MEQTVVSADSPFWHPFSQIYRGRQGVTFVSGDGTRLVDAEGREYFDATASLWYSLIGHGREEMAEAIAAQVRSLEACSCFDVYASDRTLELADVVADLVPVDEPWVFFTSGGSDSVETAVKVARLFWAESGKPAKRAILHRAGSYHGTHGIGTSLAGIEANRSGFGALVEETSEVPMFDARAVETEIARLGPDRIAALIAEPVIGAGGVHPPPDGYLRAVAEICARHDVLFIADEVVTGFGRTGSAFASERYGVRPDMMILAKGLTSGYLPLGAVVFSGRIVEPFTGPRAPWLRHGYTYSGHATACAAALANLKVIRREKLVDRVAALAPALDAALAGLNDDPGVREVRTVGLTAAVELEVPADRAADAGHEVVDACRRRGVLTRLLAGGALHVSPPFVVEEHELEGLAEVIRDAVGEVLGMGAARSAV